MAYHEMVRTDFNPQNTNSGSVYHNIVEISAGTYSDLYILPVLEIYAVSVYLDGDGDIEFCNDPPATIRSGSPVWIAWNGTDLISVGVTGFRVKRNAGTVTAKVTVKTAES